MAADWISLLSNGPKPQDIGNSFQQGQLQAMQMAAYQRQQQQQQAALALQAQTRARINAALMNHDYDSAAAAAYSGGDEVAGKGIGDLSKNHYDRATANAGHLGGVTAAVAALPYDQRKAAIQSAKPQLVQMGLDPAEVDAFDPTDQNIRALSAIDFSTKDQAAAATAQQNANAQSQTANAAQYTAETGRITAENPLVVGNSLVTRSGQELFRAPQYINAPLTDNVLQVPGVNSQGYTQGATGPDQVWANMIHQEHGTNPDGSFRTSPKGAIGPAQVMPGTAPMAAKLAGLPWDPVKYQTDPAYNMALGKAYFASLLQHYNGDAEKAAAAYNAGPGSAQKGNGVDGAIARAQAAGQPEAWRQFLPAETRGYISNVIGQQQTTRQPQLVQQGVPAAGKNGQTPFAQQSTMDAFDRAIRTGKQLLNHPGFSAAVGSGFDPASWGSINPVSGKPFAGTNAADFRANLDSLKSQVFLPMVQSMLHMGALSDIEGDTLKKSIGALDTNMSEAAFKSSLTQVIADLSKYRDNAARVIAQGTPQGGLVHNATSAPPGAVAMLRQNPSLRVQFEAKYGAGSAAAVLGQ